ncbi:MAG TPA: coniferyl aldehyde dehydrogenase [Gemmatimonadaceae bacterium]|nr:coniferyl aldehyde dehydrogenase [Gemmatimonadaceae bacterium]
MPPLTELFAAQRAAFERGAPSYERRMEALLGLRNALREHEHELADAISADFGGRAIEETRLLELLPLLDLIRYARRHLASWMRPRRARGTWFLLPAKAYILPQPLGVVGVIGAWNYPVLLTLGPVVDAIAAGNHVMIKPSELVPRTSALLAAMISDRFPADYATVVNGGREVGEAFSALPFDHLVFTGSTGVGSLVMRAASANLTPVTLELGGKSPAIVHESYPLDKALRRILQGKLYNAGQTCIAPDYLLAPAGSEGDIESIATKIVADLYPRLVDNTDYTRILSTSHYERIQGAVAEAQLRGARVVAINPAKDVCSHENKVLPPTLIFDPPPNAEIMRTEIFGPVLPVVPYRTLDEAIAFVNARPRPLALYYFDNDQTRIAAVLARTTSGGVTVNDVLYHIGQHGLPFGGVGPSGMGHYHGRHGFERLSKMKGVMVQGRLAPTGMFAPPFTGRVRAMITRLLGIAGR